jgi:hypothetical protein
MASKKTVVENFDAIKDMLNGKTVEGYTLEDALSFLDKRIEITQKKNANRGENAKPTKTQLENEDIKAVILSALSTIGKPTTIGDLVKSSAELSGYSNQKISSLLTQLLKADKVERTEVKGKAYYALPTPSTED